MRLTSLVGPLLFLLVLSRVIGAQSASVSGDIKGTVTDPSGAVVSKATVIAVDTARGLRRISDSDTSGEYRIQGLSPGSYDVSVEQPGFRKEVHKGVVVNVGRTVIVDFRMQVSPRKEVVEVSSEPPVVDTERGHQADTVNRQYIAALPIDRRDYLAYTLLMPGVADSRTLADAADFRVKQTPQSGLSFNGSNGRGNSVTVDGGEANDDAGGVRLTLSQDAIQEFQINRSNYSAELGAASGANINIVSRSGANRFHGTAYAFFRNDALDARDPFAFGPALKPGNSFSLIARAQPVKPPLNRQQFGATAGFPIHKDKTFLFVSYEGLRRDESASVPLLTDTSIFAPSAGQTAILNGLQALGSGVTVPCITNSPNPPISLPADACAAALSGLLTVNPASGPLDSFVVNQFTQNSGVFPFSAISDLASVRLDHQFSENNRVYLRYSFGRNDEHDPNLQALTAFSRGNEIRMWDSTVQGAWYQLLSPRSQNEARVQWTYNEFDVVPNDHGGPGLDVAGYGLFNRNIFLPNFGILRHYEFADNVTLVRGHHAMKMGANVLVRGDRAESHTLMSGRFGFGPLPGGVLSPCLQDPITCQLSLTAASLTALQSFKLGAPQFYQQGFGDPVVASTQPFTAVYWQDSWSVRPNLTLNFGLRYELDKQYAPLNTDKDNFAPRFSFAWDPRNDHKTVVRGGYGIFYSRIYYQIDYVVRALNDLNGFRQIAQVFVPLTGAPGNANLTSALVFRTLFAQGRIGCGTPAAEACITPADLNQPALGITVTHTGPIPPLSVIFGGSPDYQNPYSQQAEFGIERELSPSLSISASYIYAHTLNLPRARDANLLPAPLIAAGPAGIPIRQWNLNPQLGAAPCAADPLACFVNPLLLQGDVYESTAGALYNAGILELKKRFSSHFSLFANYTYSKAQDDVTDYNADFAANDETNLRAERALSAFEQRHKVVVAGVFESPWKGVAGSNLAERLFSGFTISPVFRANSSRPFNLLVGADINNDRHPTTDRPPGAGRNSGIGPNFCTFDLRLTRQFGLGEERNLQFTFEAFDLLNRTNFSSVNNTVGVIGPPFNLSASSALSPSQPLAYTAALPRREIQLGVRLNF